MKIGNFATALPVYLLFALAGSAMAQTVPAAKTLDEPPAVIFATAPYYPQSARINSNEYATGKVVVELAVDNGGLVNQAKTISGHPLLRRACEQAAKNWRFAPRTGPEGLRIVRLTFNFTVIEDDQSATVEDRQHERVTFAPPYRIEIGIYPKITTNRET